MTISKTLRLGVVACFLATPAALAANARQACADAARALVNQQTTWDESRGFGGDALRWRAANGTRGTCRVDQRGRVEQVTVEYWSESGDDIIVWPDPGASDLTEEPDYDRRGDDYTSLRTASLGLCQEGCRRDARCRAYTYSRREGRCWLKTRANSRQFNPEMVTGYKTGGSSGGPGMARLTEEPGQDRRGNDYVDFRAFGLRDCQDACLRDSRCQAYTFDTRTRVCYLKDRVPSPKGDLGMVTGYKRP